MPDDGAASRGAVDEDDDGIQAGNVAPPVRMAILFVLH